MKLTGMQETEWRSPDGMGPRVGLTTLTTPELHLILRPVLPLYVAEMHHARLNMKGILQFNQMCSVLKGPTSQGEWLSYVQTSHSKALGCQWPDCNLRGKPITELDETLACVSDKTIGQVLFVLR